MNCILTAYCLASSAADTFCGIDLCHDRNLHGTDIFALSAADAFVFVPADPVQRPAVEQGIKGSLIFITDIADCFQVLLPDHLEPVESCFVPAVLTVSGGKHADQGADHSADLFRIDLPSISKAVQGMQ